MACRIELRNSSLISVFRAEIRVGFVSILIAFANSGYHLPYGFLYIKLFYVQTNLWSLCVLCFFVVRELFHLFESPSALYFSLTTKEYCFVPGNDEDTKGHIG